MVHPDTSVLGSLMGYLIIQDALTVLPRVGWFHKIYVLYLQFSGFDSLSNTQILDPQNLTNQAKSGNTESKEELRAPLVGCGVWGVAG